MVKIVETDKLNREYDYIGAYIKMIEDNKDNAVVFNFSDYKALRRGYNTIRQYIIRHDLQERVSTSMRNDDYLEIHRIVISGRKRRDLLYLVDNKDFKCN